jgi:hypothetical protein
MSKKTTVLRLALVVAAVTVMAVPIQPFTSWRDLTERAADISIARCSKTPDPFNMKTNGVGIDMEGGLIESDIEVLFVLKGATNVGPTRLLSQYWPRQGENYLIFSSGHVGSCQAIEPYRVVPLGTYFPTNVLAGKPLEQQIQVVLQYRLVHLNQELTVMQEEKKRLEEGLKK